MRGTKSDSETALEQIAKIDWTATAEALNGVGCAVVGPLLASDQCRHVEQLYTDSGRFRKRVDMSRHGYGRGEYQYFDCPLPELVASLRARLYPPLAEIANAWCEQLKLDVRFPPSLDLFLERCHAAQQTKPTPLLLRYQKGDYNCLHQDVYGEHVFPLQVAVLLSRPGEDFTGGEFVMTQQRPRQLTRPEVVSWQQGQAVIFPVRQRPVQGARGIARAAMRHGVSRLHSGTRFTLGIIFHDAA